MLLCVPSVAGIQVKHYQSYIFRFTRPKNETKTVETRKSYTQRKRSYITHTEGPYLHNMLTSNHSNRKYSKVSHDNDQ